MFYTRNHLLQKPGGVNDFLPDKVQKYRHIEQRILDKFNKWGYEEVFVPTIEYPDMFTLDKDKSFEREMFQFSDETGRPVVLRPDFTPSIARLIATYYANNPKPIRLCYSGRVYRSGHTNMSQEKELYQTGVELVGDGAPAGDAEIAAMAAAILSDIGLKDFVICIGNMNFIETFLSELGLSEQDQQQIKETLNENDLVKFRNIVSGFDLPQKNKELLAQLPKFRGTKKDLKKIKESLSDLEVSKILTELDDIFDILDGYGVQDKVTFDLSLVRKLDYYTGFIMEGYSERIGFPLCGGGRYDKLMNRYGIDLSATGFAFSFDSIMKLMSEEDTKQDKGKVFFSYQDEERADALEIVKELRDSGCKVIVDLESSSKDEALDKARAHGAAELQYYKNDHVITHNVFTHNK